MKTEKIINKTPHSVYLLKEDHSILRMFPKSNGMIRVNEVVTDVGTIEGVPISSTEWSETTDVPDFIEGTYYIVSQLVKNALSERKDLLVPKGVIRDVKGNIIGCTRLDIGAEVNSF